MISPSRINVLQGISYDVRTLLRNCIDKIREDKKEDTTLVEVLSREMPDISVEGWKAIYKANGIEFKLKTEPETESGTLYKRAIEEAKKLKRYGALIKGKSVEKDLPPYYGILVFDDEKTSVLEKYGIILKKSDCKTDKEKTKRMEVIHRFCCFYALHEFCHLITTENEKLNSLYKYGDVIRNSGIGYNEIEMQTEFITKNVWLQNSFFLQKSYENSTSGSFQLGDISKDLGMPFYLILAKGRELKLWE